jgi:hypothetical protein
MITEIGIVAGEIWHFLDNHHGQASLNDIVGGIERPRDLVILSLGWLAREGHIHLQGAPDSNYVASLAEATA